MNAHAPRRVLVVAHDDAAVTDALKVHGGRARKLTHNAHAIDLPPGADEAAVMAQLKRDARFDAVELDELIPPAMIVNDPYAAQEWHLTKIGAQAAWDIAQGAGVTIAILGTGVEPTHPDLVANLVPGWNVLLGNTDTHDVNGHETTVAGTAAAAGNNGVDVCGVAFRAKIMPVVVADANAYAYWSNVAAGLTWAADHGAHVANISYDGASASATIQSAATYFRNAGGVVVTAAGNSGTASSTPPTNTMLVCAGTDQTDAHWPSSTYGSFVDIAAPSIGIITTGPSAEVWNCYGTSHASPIVAGVVALMMSANPALPNTQIEQLLLASATDLGTAGVDPYFGAGRVNAAAAVLAAKNAIAVAPTPPPAPAPSPAPTPSPAKGHGHHK